MLLKNCVEDIMNDYQRLTPTEAKKFDRIYGDVIDTASRAVFTLDIGSESNDLNEINFRDIDVDLIFEISVDLFKYLKDRDEKFK